MPMPMLNTARPCPSHAQNRLTADHDTKTADHGLVVVVGDARSILAELISSNPRSRFARLNALRAEALGIRDPIGLKDGQWLVWQPVEGGWLPRYASATHARSGAYKQHDLVSDIPGLARVTDRHLINSWGMAFSPTRPFVIADDSTGVVHQL